MRSAEVGETRGVALSRSSLATRTSDLVLRSELLRRAAHACVPIVIHSRVVITKPPLHITELLY
jgi:hypothetical protein